MDMYETSEWLQETYKNEYKEYEPEYSEAEINLMNGELAFYHDDY